MTFLLDQPIKADSEVVVAEDDPLVDVPHPLAGILALIPACVERIPGAAHTHKFGQLRIDLCMGEGASNELVFLPGPVVGTTGERLDVLLWDDEVATRCDVSILDRLDQVRIPGLSNHLHHTVLETERTDLAVGIGFHGFS